MVLITISLCMIVKNEEDVLARCLESVKDAVDEMIIVDTGSTDRTKEIAASLGAKVYDFEWINHFAAARNFSFKQATCDYILWLDADDVLLPEDLNRLIELKQRDDFNYDTVTMKYHLSFDENGNPTYSYRRNRLVKRSMNFEWFGPVHEYLAVYGASYHSDIAVTHRKVRHASDRNLNIYLARLEQGEEFTPRDQFYFANELRDHARYEEAIKWYDVFLDGKKGWVEDNIAACSRKSFCYAELKQNDLAIRSLLQTLEYTPPRPDFCCQLGNLFLHQNRYSEAIYWYSQALSTSMYTTDMSFHNPATATWLPHLQLTVCYDRIGNTEKAVLHHKHAKELNPKHPSVNYNENYFKNKGVL